MATSDGTNHIKPLENAKQLFVLLNPVTASNSEWGNYTANRLGAARFQPNNDEDIDDGDESSGQKITLDAILTALEILEDEKDLNPGVLTSNFKILKCDAIFDDEEPRTVTTHTRVYSPCRPNYVDVHFQYHCRSRTKSIEWSYKLGFKVYRRASKDFDYTPPIMAEFEQGSFESAYGSGGWQAVAYAFFHDHIGGFHGRWRRVEEWAFKLSHDGILDAHEVLWGCLEETPTDKSHEEREDYFRGLVDTVRILLAAVGIEYLIACDHTEDDVPCSMWMLEGLSDSWFARETRKACGFQLKDDCKKEREAMEEREEARRDDLYSLS